MGRFFCSSEADPEHIVRGMNEIKIAAKDPSTAKGLKQSQSAGVTVPSSDSRGGPSTPTIPRTFQRFSVEPVAESDEACQ